MSQNENDSPQGIFENREVGNAVTVDLDVYFYHFARSLSDLVPDEKQGITIHAIRERMIRLQQAIHFTRFVMEYRRSSNDHVHLRLTFPDTKISVLDAFMIRAWLFDDQTRLELDLARYLLTNSLHEMNRCFDEKATVNGVKRAGPWIPISQDRKHFTGEILEDYLEYLKRFNVPTTRQSPIITGS